MSCGKIIAHGETCQEGNECDECTKINSFYHHERLFKITIKKLVCLLNECLKENINNNLSDEIKEFINRTKNYWLYKDFLN
jgi:hypothetical protein